MYSKATGTTVPVTTWKTQQLRGLRVHRGGANGEQLYVSVRHDPIDLQFKELEAYALTDADAVVIVNDLLTLLGIEAKIEVKEET